MEKSITHNNRTLKYNLEYRKVKNINLHIKKDKTIHISANAKTPITNIEAFIIKKWDWIIKALSQLEQKKDVTTYQNAIFIFGKAYPLIIKTGSKRIELKNEMTIYYPDVNDVSGIRRLINDHLLKLLRQQVDSSRYRYDQIMDDYHHLHPEIFYRKMNSRWGSCHYQKNKITLNTDLVYYPLVCLEYVLLHEYLHFVVNNHSARFYELLAYHMPEYKKYKELLKRF